MGHPIIILSLVTLIAVLAIALWQRRSVRSSQARHGETPGETTMTRHASREAPAPVDTRIATSGEVTSFKAQDERAAAEGVRGEKPITTPARAVHHDA